MWTLGCFGEHIKPWGTTFTRDRCRGRMGKWRVFIPVVFPAIDLDFPKLGKSRKKIWQRKLGGGLGLWCCQRRVAHEDNLGTLPPILKNGLLSLSSQLPSWRPLFHSGDFRRTWHYVKLIPGWMEECPSFAPLTTWFQCRAPVVPLSRT